MLAKRKYKRWSKGEDELVLSPNATVAQVARQLERTEDSVVARRQALQKVQHPVPSGELLPCPFCPDGGAPFLERAGTTGLYWGACRKCRTQGPPRMVRAQAIVAWNTRQRPSAAQATQGEG